MSIIEMNNDIENDLAGTKEVTDLYANIEKLKKQVDNSWKKLYS